MTKKWTGERWETTVQNETALEHLHRYAFACDLSAGKNVLDIACGEGYGTALLARNAQEVIGVDIDASTIEKAKEKYNDGNIHFMTANALSTPLPDHSFDRVVSFETLEHLEEQDQLLQEFKRLLKPDGLLIISTPDKAQYSDHTGYQNPFHQKELYQEEFNKLLRRHFRQVQILTQTICHSSMISTGNQKGLDVYSGNHEHIEKNRGGNGLYLVAIASDMVLPEVTSSLFNGKSVLQAALENQEKAFRQSLTYRIGHILLSPFKWIKKRFD